MAGPPTPTQGLLSGEVDMIFSNPPSARPLVDADEVTLLAITGEERDEVYPDVPTLKESGMQDFVTYAWYGFSAPAGTPSEIVERLNAVVLERLQDPTLQERLGELGSFASATVHTGGIHGLCRTQCRGLLCCCKKRLASNSIDVVMMIRNEKMTMFTAMQGHCSRALRAAAAALVGAGAISPAIAWAQEDYPSRPIEIVVPFSPGGSGEMSARIIQTAMEEVLGQPIVVVARPGAATNIGTFSVVQAEPDGYTLLMGATALTANPHIYSSLEFDPLTDLIPISIVINSPLMLAANPALGAQDVADVTRIATERPGELNFASSGVGSSAHLNGEFFTYTAGLNIQHIPYSGGGPAMQAALSGEVDLISSNVTNLQGLVENGDLVPIGVAAAERSPMLPEVPDLPRTGGRLRVR